MEITGSIWDIITAIAAIGGLGFAGYQLHKNNQTLRASNEEQKRSNRVRELQLLRDAFQQINRLEQFFYEQVATPNPIKWEEWFVLFFNQIEWLSHLITAGFITYPELQDYFSKAFIRWYEDIFLKDTPTVIANNPAAFENFKNLYDKYKKLKEEEERLSQR